MAVGTVVIVVTGRKLWWTNLWWNTFCEEKLFCDDKQVWWQKMWWVKTFCYDESSVMREKNYL